MERKMCPGSKPYKDQEWARVNRLIGAAANNPVSETEEWCVKCQNEGTEHDGEHVAEGQE